MARVRRRQPVRYRSLLVIAVITMLLGVLATYFVGMAIGSRSFDEIERSIAIDNTERLQSAYDAEVERLAVMAGDWGMWDDTYDFMRRQQPDYVQTNLVEETLQNLGVNVIAFYAADGSLRHATYLDPNTGALGEPPAGIGTLGERMWPDDTTALLTTSSLVQDESGLMLCAVHPITTSDASAEPVGVLLFGRYVDDAFVASIAEYLKVSVSRVDPTDYPVESAAGDLHSVVTLDEDAIYGTRVFWDVDGQPALVLRLSMPRTIADRGEQALSSFAFALAVVGLVLLVVLLAALRQERRAYERQREAEDATRRAQNRYRALVEGMADAVLGLDAEGNLTFANPRACRLLRRSPDELESLRFRDVMAADSAAIVADDVLPFVGEVSTRDLTLVDAQGSPVAVEVSVAWFSVEPGAPQQMQWIMRDVSERKRFERELVHLATHDHLTGLFNRLRFEEELERRLSHTRRGEKPTVLLWLDLDNFKEVNDSLGHKAGDDLLVGLSLELSRRLRPDSVLARLGGDEFGVLIPDVDVSEVMAVASRLLDDIRAMEFLTEGGRVRLTPSIGVVLLPDHATTPEEALARADLAMYRAKGDGGNRVCVYEPDADWQEELRMRFDWAIAIESALREDRILVHWQPIIELETGMVDRYELLVRLTDEQGNVVPPGVFLPVAEQLGLIGAIDLYMVRRAVRLLAQYPPETGVRIDVNFSGRALSDPALPELIAQELSTRGVDPERLGIEITETVAVVDMVKARTFIESLKSIGVRVTLDDFGSGFSSFYYLRNLPIDALKIDGTFVRELTENRRDQHVVRSMVELAAGLNIDITAECVESQETLEMLRSFGVRFAQGFHMGRPTEAGGVEE